MALVAALGVVAAVLASCGGGQEAERPFDWAEESISFPVGATELDGVLTVPDADGPHPTVIIASGSETPEGTLQSGISNGYFTALAHELATQGYAAFRYDTVGAGQPIGEPDPGGLEAKRDEVLGALEAVSAHSAVRADAIGLWGASQEAWVISMAAAERPDAVSFVISVSGSGISVAEQQVWGVETQSRAAGLAGDDVDRATLVAGLLVDWQLDDPLFEAANQDLAAGLGNGPWSEFFDLVYGSSTTDPEDHLQQSIDLLTAMEGEAWAEALHLDTLYLPTLRQVTPEQLEAIRPVAAATLVVDPRDDLSRVTSPVLAFFGENDIVQPSERSAELYARYLDEAGNDDVTLVTLADVDHSIDLSTPGYRDRLIEWLDLRTGA